MPPSRVPPVPRRGLGAKGIWRDPSPVDLPPDAFSAGSNVVFDGNAVHRGPVFKTLYANPAGIHPVGVVGRKSPSGFDTLFILGSDGTIMSLVSATLTNVTPVTWTASSAEDQWTSTFLGDVTYVNRPTHVPYGFGSSSSDFEEMPSWDSTWRCAALRTYKDALVAMNVTKGATNYPQMVKTSDKTLAGLFPGSWDHTDPATNAVENQLGDLTTPLVDGAVLGDSFVLYSQDQVWVMTAVATNDVYVFRKILSDGGIIAQNCVVEADGRHYVFGPSDIYRHGGSGVDKESIVEGLNRRAIFNEIDLGKAKRCFVQHIPRLRAIMFCYPTVSGVAPFEAVNGCNRAFVFHYATGAHSFVDLPDVTGGTLANVEAVPLWSTMGGSWAELGGTWASMTGSLKSHVIFSTTGLNGSAATDKLVGYDFKDRGSMSLPFDVAYNTTAFVERTGIDLDDQGAPLRAFKVFNGIFPQIEMVSPAPVFFEIGSARMPGGTTSWDPPRPFTPGSSYKVDARKAGRYLGLRLSGDDGASGPLTAVQASDWSWSGYDVEVTDGGRR